MTDFVVFFSNMMSSLVSVLDSAKFSLYGFDVSIIGIMVAIIVVGLVISVFWKGARF